MEQTGQLSEQNIRDAFTKFGREVSDEEMKTIMDQHCEGGMLHIDHGGKFINREEFDKIFDICVDK